MDEKQKRRRKKRQRIRRDWYNQPAVVFASGPSLTFEDVERVRAFGCKTIAVNSTWKLVPFCDVLFAGDKIWWANYGEEVDIAASKYTYAPNAARLYNLRIHKSKLPGAYNSGMLAVELAIQFGASPVIMLGFDCSVAKGVHHHGKHKHTPNPNPRRCSLWTRQFKRLREVYPSVPIINCSRYTELKCFPRGELEEVLCGLG